MEGMFEPWRLLIEANLSPLGVLGRRAMVCFVNYAIEYSQTEKLTACCRWCLYGQFAARNVHQKQLPMLPDRSAAAWICKPLILPVSRFSPEVG
jgi:hypothetical protein